MRPGPSRRSQRARSPGVPRRPKTRDRAPPGVVPRARGRLGSAGRWGRPRSRQRPTTHQTAPPSEHRRLREIFADVSRHGLCQDPGMPDPVVPGAVTRGVAGGVPDGREALGTVEQDRHERVCEPVGCIRSISPSSSSTPSSSAARASSTSSRLTVCWASGIGVAWWPCRVRQRSRRSTSTPLSRRQATAASLGGMAAPIAPLNPAASGMEGRDELMEYRSRRCRSNSYVPGEGAFGPTFGT